MMKGLKETLKEICERIMSKLKDLNGKISLFFRSSLERFKMNKSLRNGNLDLNVLSDFYRLLAINKISKDDKFAMYLGMHNRDVYQFAFGDTNAEAGPVMKIYTFIVPSNGTIRIEVKYSHTLTRVITESITFKDRVDIDHVRDDVPNNYYFTAERIDVIKNTICSSMIYTLHNYIRRWY